MSHQQQGPVTLGYATRPRHQPLGWAGKATLITSILLCAYVVLGLVILHGPRSREISKATACSANLKAIATSCLIYSEAHKGELPASLDILLEGGERAYLQPKQLVCPTTGQRYIYVPGLKNTDDPRFPVVFESVGNHGDGANVAFLDGHAQWQKRDDYVRLMNWLHTHPAPAATAETMD